MFFRLRQVQPGSLVMVRRADGRTLRFVVDQVREYPKTRVPASRVFGLSSLRPELRLITCGGDFDARSGHYVDNVVVFAHLV